MRYTTLPRKTGNKATFKKAKGIKYVKVVHFFRYYYGPENTDHVRDLYGKFSKPVKIK